jgi:hypothetical protein
MLHDPQTFGEKLYDNLHRHGEPLWILATDTASDKQYSLQHKIPIMQLLSRVMGSHKLCVLGFYSYIIKYTLDLSLFGKILTARSDTSHIINSKSRLSSSPSLNQYTSSPLPTCLHLSCGN